VSWLRPVYTESDRSLVTFAKRCLNKTN